MKGSACTPRVAAIVFVICAAVAAYGQPNTWSYRAHMLMPRSSFGAATGPDGRIYAIGGMVGVSGNYAVYTNTVEAYDPSTNSWSYVAPLLDTLVNGKAATGPDGKIYATDGRQLHVYDTSNNTWKFLAPPPVGIDPEGFCFGNDGRLYLIQGEFPNDFPPARVEIYNIATDTWSDPSTPVPFDLPRAGSAAMAADGFIFWTGGFDVGGSTIPYTTYYDSLSDVWVSASYMNVQRVGHCVAPGGDNRLYAIGGQSAFDVLESSAEALDLNTGVWSFIPNLPDARNFASAVEGKDGKVYVLGGYSSDLVLVDSVECFQPAMMSARAINIQAQEGVAFNGTVGSIADANKALTAANFTVTIDWGDGSQSAGTVSGSAGSFSISGTHTYAEPGTFPTTLTVTNSDGENAAPIGQATVVDATISCSSLNFNASANLPFSGKVGSFTDANAIPKLSDFSATITWGDGSSSTGTASANGSGGFDVSGSHTYPTVGNYTVSVSVSDIDGATGSSTGTAIVSEPAPFVTPMTINAFEGVTYVGQVASLTDADPSLGASAFIAAINWGDGTSSSGSVTSNGSGGFNLSGTHKYLEEGSYPISVSVTANGSAPGVAGGTALVADAPITATGYSLIEKGLTFSDTVATFTDADPAGAASDYTAGIVWGDGKSSNGTIVAFGSGWKVVGSHSYLKRGKYTATIHMKDVGGATATATTLINAGPVK